MTSARTKTRPDVKWTVNELSAVKGELERIDEEVTRLRKRAARLKRVEAALSKVFGTIVKTELPLAFPVVRTQSRYGGRGNLRNFLRESLKAAYPSAVSKQALTDRAVQVFELKFASRAELKRFSDDNLGNALRRLLARREVERLHDWEGVPDMPGVWRWKMDAPTLDELRRSAAEVAGVNQEALWR